MTELIFIPTIVDACGNAAEGVGTEVTGVAGRFTSTIEVINQHSGLASVDALKSCQTAWSGRIKQQGSEASTAGAFLHQAVKDYLATDQHSARNIHRTGRNYAI